MARFVNVDMRQKSRRVKISFESLFGKPHVGGPRSVCHGGQHSLFCLKTWNVLHFLWTPDRQLACVKDVSLNTRVPLRSEMRTPGGARWAETDWGSWGGCCLLFSPLPWGVRSSGGLAGLYVYVCLPPSCRCYWILWREGRCDMTAVAIMPSFYPWRRSSVRPRGDLTG